MFPLNRDDCHRPVIFSACGLVTSPATWTNNMRTCPFFDCLRRSSTLSMGFEGSNMTFGCLGFFHA